jgi:hypothetical protein
MGQKPENQQSSEIKTANESLEAPKFEDTPIEDKKPVEENENNTEINEADPLENTGTDKTPSPHITDSEPQSFVDRGEQDSKLESDAEDVPSEPLSEKDASEEGPLASDVEASGDITEAVKKEDVDNGNDDRVEPVNTSANRTKPAAKRSNLSKLSFSIILMVVIIIVIFAYAKPWHYRLKKEPQPLSLQTAVQTPVEVSVAPAAKAIKPEQNDPYQIYRAKLRDVNKLRETLLLKKHEIGELKKHYRAGVKTLENEILLETLRKNIHTLQQALKNKRIELKIKAIQRRLVYIDKLDRPLKWLEQGSEELLYLKRKANFDLLMVEIVSGIDMDMHMRHINAALQKYRLTADNLAINTENAKLLPLETLWNKLYEKTKNNPHLLADIENWFIEQEVCSGDLKRTGELSGISAEAARCIAQMEGSDLFLNGIEDLSPTIAKQLCQWRGKWICLNGVRDLSPSAAKHLFQWEGEWISLNGLSAFPPELARYLGQWKGKQLELMGLAFNKDQHDKIALRHMAEWEKAGGKLFVPESIRTLINMVNKI